MLHGPMPWAPPSPPPSPPPPPPSPPPPAFNLPRLDLRNVDLLSNGSLLLASTTGEESGFLTLSPFAGDVDVTATIAAHAVDPGSGYQAGVALVLSRPGASLADAPDTRDVASLMYKIHDTIDHTWITFRARAGTGPEQVWAEAYDSRPHRVSQVMLRIRRRGALLQAWVHDTADGDGALWAEEWKWPADDSRVPEKGLAVEEGPVRVGLEIRKNYNLWYSVEVASWSISGVSVPPPAPPPSPVPARPAPAEQLPLKSKVAASISLNGISSDDFTEEMQFSFRGGVAATVGVEPSQVTIISVVETTAEPQRRRALQQDGGLHPVVSLQVEFEIDGLDSPEEAGAISRIIEKSAKLPEDEHGSLLKELKDQGLTKITSLQVTSTDVVVEQQPTGPKIPPGEFTRGFAGIVIPGGEGIDAGKSDIYATLAWHAIITCAITEPVTPALSGCSCNHCWQCGWRRGNPAAGIDRLVPLCQNTEVRRGSVS